MPGAQIGILLAGLSLTHASLPALRRETLAPNQVVEISSLGDVIQKFPAEPAPRGFNYIARGRCKVGYTAGEGEQDNAVDAATCAAVCLRDPNCTFFSFIPNHALTSRIGDCARYDKRAGDCRDRTDDKRYNTYQRSMFASFSYFSAGSCQEGYYAGDTLPGAMNGSWCAALCAHEDCDFFSTLSDSPTGGACYRYKLGASRNCTVRQNDWKGYATYKRSGQRYSFVGDGPCKSSPKIVRTQLLGLSTCAEACSKDTNCTFFSFSDTRFASNTTSSRNTTRSINGTLSRNATSRSFADISNSTSEGNGTEAEGTPQADATDISNTSDPANATNASNASNASNGTSGRDLDPINSTWATQIARAQENFTGNESLNDSQDWNVSVHAPDLSNEGEVMTAMAPNSTFSNIHESSPGICVLFAASAGSCAERLSDTRTKTFRKI